MTGTAKKPSPPGLDQDPVFFKVLTEIDMIAHMAAVAFERRLPEGLTAAQFGVLNRAIRLGRIETVGELADAFQVTQPTMSSTVKKLEAKALIEFVPDPDDRRIKRVRPTAAAHRLREKTLRSLQPLRDTIGGEADIDWARMLPPLTRLRAFFEDHRDE